MKKLLMIIMLLILTDCSQQYVVKIINIDHIQNNSGYVSIFLKPIQKIWLESITIAIDTVTLELDYCNMYIPPKILEVAENLKLKYLKCGTVIMLIKFRLNPESKTITEILTLKME